MKSIAERFDFDRTLTYRNSNIAEFPTTPSPELQPKPKPSAKPQKKRAPRCVEHKKGQTKKLTDEQFAECVSRIGTVSLNKMAAEYGVHITTITTRLQAKGIEYKPLKVRKMSDAQIAEAIDMRSKYTTASVAKYFGVTPSCITKLYGKYDPQPKKQ